MPDGRLVAWLGFKFAEAADQFMGGFQDNFDLWEPTTAAENICADLHGDHKRFDLERLPPRDTLHQLQKEDSSMTHYYVLNMTRRRAYAGKTVADMTRSWALPVFEWLEDQMAGKYEVNDYLHMMISFGTDDDAAIFKLFWQQEINYEETEEYVAEEINRRRKFQAQIEEAKTDDEILKILTSVPRLKP